jgi:hypothetical protein
MNAVLNRASVCRRTVRTPFDLSNIFFSVVCMSRVYYKRVMVAMLSGSAWWGFSGVWRCLEAQSVVAASEGPVVTVPASAAPEAGRFTLTISPIPMASRGLSTRALTASEAAAQANQERMGKWGSLSWRSRHYAADSLRRATSETVQRWVGEVHPARAQGIHLDLGAALSVAMDDDAAAQAQIAERLATPGLSLSDKAYTLRRAVYTFCDNWAPQRLPVAEQYLQQLIALGAEATPWQFEARESLMRVYYFLGRSSEVARHGKSAIALLSNMPLGERHAEYTMPQVYPMTVDALLSLPDASAQVAALNDAYRAGAVIPPAERARLTAIDTIYAKMAEFFPRYAKSTIATHAKLGTPGVPIIAHYWLNRASTDSATIPVNDGKIRLLEVGNTDCPGCVAGFYAMQRLHEQFPQIEPIVLAFTWGAWGGKIVDRFVEAAHLRDYFLTRVKATYPVAIWAGKRIPNEDDGASVEPNPNFKTYQPLSKPAFWLLDGRGVIRKVFLGYGRDIEVQLAHSIEFLLAEARAASSSPASAITSGSASSASAAPAIATSTPAPAPGS